MARIIVGILRGGSSSEYDHSLKSGAAILKALPEDRYDTRDIFVDRAGLWHSRGMPASPARALSQIDVVFNVLHGGAGEDGTVQRILQRAGIRFPGSDALSSNMSMNKIAARSVLQQAGVKIPMGMHFTASDGTTAEMAMQVFAKFSPPYVVKPPMEGASFGIILAESLIALPDAIGDVIDAYGTALVEEFLLGKEASVGVIENFRNEDLYALPPAQVVLPQGARYLDKGVIAAGSHEYLVPNNFTHEEKQAIAQLARDAHRALGLSHYSNADIMMTNHGPYLMEVNTSPHLHEKAPFHHMLESVGSSVRDFAEHAISLAEKN